MTSQATFTVVLGSIGRPSLRTLLDSIARQGRRAGDQCIVSIDSFERGELPEVQRLVRSYGDGFIACAYNSGYHFLGIEQINYALRTIPITGTHILTIGDDDVFVDGAYAALRPYCSADLNRPVLYRVVSPPSVTDPKYRDLFPVGKYEYGRIGGSSIAAPIAHTPPMTTEKTLAHDYNWVQDVLRNYGREPLWLDYTAVIARPDPLGDGVVHRGVWTCPCGCWGYLDHYELGELNCHFCAREIDPSSREPRVWTGEAVA